MIPSGSFVQRLARRPAFVDACVLLAVFVAGTIVGARYVGAFQEKGVAEFGQPEFGAAVALACGRGFLDPQPEGDALKAFLARQRDRLSCSDLPSPFRGAPPNFTQRLYRYLMMAVAWTWRATGIAWSALPPLFGVMFALTLCAAYGLFRLAGGPLVAAAGVIPLAVSAHHLGMLPELRDYAKAPFLLLLMLVMARLALPPYSRVKAVVLSCVFGVVLGIGFGFRNDILICVPPFVVVIGLLLPVAWRDELRVKAACLAVAAVMFVVSAWPILRAYGQGSNTGHVAVLGLMTPFDGPLALTRPPYDFGTHYDDRFAGALIGTRSTLRGGRFADYLSPEYDREGVGLMLGVARHFPADIFVRSVASMLAVFDFPFTTSGIVSPQVPIAVTSRWATAFYGWQAATLKLLTGLGPLLVAAAVLAIASENARGGAVLILLILYYCGYPAIQFHIRHFFHLEFVVWWALVFLVAGSVRALTRRVRREPVRVPVRTRAIGAAAAAAVMALAIGAPLWALRAYQQSHVQTLLQQLQQQPRRPLTLSRSVDGDRENIALERLWEGLRPGEVRVRYLAAEFSPEHCAAADVPLLLKYETTYGLNDFTTLFRVVVDPAGPTVQYAPVFADAVYSRFNGLRLPAAYGDCLRSVSVVDGIGDLPVAIDARIAPDVRDVTWFQRLVHWEHAPLSPYPAVHAHPADLAVSRAAAAAGLLQPDRVAAGLAADGHGWSGVATAYVPQSRLLHFPEQDVKAGAVLFADGVLRRGGLQIGILQNDEWLDMQTVDTTGPFTVLVRAPHDGRYAVLVADTSTREWRLEQTSLLHLVSRYVAPWFLQDDFSLRDIAWTREGA